MLTAAQLKAIRALARDPFNMSNIEAVKVANADAIPAPVVEPAAVVEYEAVALPSVAAKKYFSNAAVGFVKPAQMHKKIEQRFIAGIATRTPDEILQGHANNLVKSPEFQQALKHGSVRKMVELAGRIK